MGMSLPKPTAASTSCVPRRLPVKPNDDLKDDPSFQQFKRRLKNIGTRRDTAALYRLLSPDFFEVGCCEDGPNYKGVPAIAGFKAMFARDPDLQWLLLEQAVRVGVVKTKRTYDGYSSERPNRLLFCGPAAKSPPRSACDFDGTDSDGDDLAFIIGTLVPLRVAPDPSAKTITALSWDTVQGLSPGSTMPDNWAKVRLGDGTVGYVDSRFVHWFLGPTLCFGKRETGQWEIRGIDLGGD